MPSKISLSKLPKNSPPCSHSISLSQAKTITSKIISPPSNAPQVLAASTRHPLSPSYAPPHRKICPPCSENISNGLLSDHPPAAPGTVPTTMQLAAQKHLLPAKAPLNNISRQPAKKKHHLLPKVLLHQSAPTSSNRKKYVPHYCQNIPMQTCQSLISYF